MIRLDGRTLNECRPIRVKENLIFSASSSIQLSMGSTTLIVAIFNKKTFKNGGKKLELEFESFDQVSRIEILNLSKITTEIILEENLRSLPEFEITINVFIIENDGNLLTVLLNAISQSLKKLKVEKSKEIIFSGIGIERKYNFFCIDPTKFESDFIREEFYFILIFDTKKKKLRFYQVARIIKDVLKNINLNKDRLYRLICEYGLYLLKILN